MRLSKISIAFLLIVQGYLGFMTSLERLAQLSEDKSNDNKIIDLNTQGPLPEDSTMLLHDGCFWPSGNHFTMYHKTLMERMKRNSKVSYVKERKAWFLTYHEHVYVNYTNHFNWAGSVNLTDYTFCNDEEMCAYELTWLFGFHWRVKFKRHEVGPGKDVLPNDPTWSVVINEENQPVITHIFKHSRRRIWFNAVNIVSYGLEYRDNVLGPLSLSKSKSQSTKVTKIPVPHVTMSLKTIGMPDGIFGFEDYKYDRKA